MRTRAAIAEAVNMAKIPGVAGSTYAPVTAASGMVWAQFASAAPEQYADATVGLDGAVDWDVMLVLPAGSPADTGSRMDEWLPAVLVALSPLGRLGTVIPVSFVIGGQSGGVPAMQIRLTT